MRLKVLALLAAALFAFGQAASVHADSTGYEGQPGNQSNGGGGDGGGSHGYEGQPGNQSNGSK